MNKTSIYCFSLAAIAIGSLASCQDYEPFDEETVREATIKKKYAEEFVKAFGEIDPEHNWGFDGQPVAWSNNVTRGINVNSNEWVTKYHLNVPGDYDVKNDPPTTGDVTDKEREYVYWWFSTHKDPIPLNVYWTDFFVQEVWGQPEHTSVKQYSDGSSYEYAGFGMDHIKFYYRPGEHNTDGATEDHVNNFNTAGSMKEKVEYVYDGSTYEFSFHSSASTSAPNENYFKNFTIQYINGNYYLAFDCESHKCSDPSHCVHTKYCYRKGYNEQHEAVDNGDRCIHGAGDPCLPADGYYNDWIIKLTPGLHLVDDASKRIMCEDLGGSFDWDFQDLVYDVLFVDESLGDGKNTTAIITLQAAGGTLPIYIGGKPGEGGVEAHGLFGVNTNQVVNAGKGSVSRPPVVFHLRGNFPSETIEGITYYNANDIPIYVDKYAHDLDKGEREPLRLLESYRGKTPEKFGCPTNVKWMEELEHISQGYPGFKTWVEKQNADGSAWYNSANESGHIYAGSVIGSQNGTYRPNSYLDGKDKNNNSYGDPAHSEGFTPWETLCGEINWSSRSYQESQFQYLSPTATAGQNQNWMDFRN